MSDKKPVRKSLYNNVEIDYNRKNWKKQLKSILNDVEIKEYYPIDRSVNQELFYYILDPILSHMEDKGLFAVKNDVFYLYKYDWVDDGVNCLEFPNFYHKPSGLRIDWYKYPLRGANSNIKLTPKKLRAVLYDCLDSWESLTGFTIEHLLDSEKWWNKKKEKSNNVE